MPGSFHGIETSSRALRAFSRSLDTIGHNIANVDTPGYSRQTVGLATSAPLDVRSGSALSLGTGVTISGINRIRDAFLTAQAREAGSEMGRLDGGYSQLQSVEGAFLDTDGKGVGDALDSFFSAWSALASNPGETGRKLEVQSAGRELAARVRSTYARVTGAKAELVTSAKSELAEADRLTRKIGELNQGIVAAKANGASPNDLLDDRERAVQALGRIVDVTTGEDPNGALNVSVGGFAVVDAAGARGFPQTYDPVAGTLSDGANTYPVGSGTIRGITEANASLADFTGRLDTLANQLRTGANGLHATGVLAGGVPAGNFFGDVATGLPQTGAVDFALDAAVAADAGKIATGISGAAGDASIALGLSRLKDAPMAGLGGKTFVGFHRDLVGDVGRGVRNRDDARITGQAVLDGIEARALSISGVSVDEEMAEMLKVQRSFQAAAKALSMFDDMAGEIIGLLNR